MLRPCFFCLYSSCFIEYLGQGHTQHVFERKKKNRRETIKNKIPYSVQKKFLFNFSDSYNVTYINYLLPEVRVLFFLLQWTNRL